MNDQFIQGVIFDWNKIDDDSYLKQIEALKNIERLEFKNSINFFVGENGSGNHCNGRYGEAAASD